MTIYTVAGGKGGVGKSSVAGELLAGLARAGRKPIGLDLDQQGNFTSWAGVVDETTIYGHTAELLEGEATLQDAATDSPTIPGTSIIVGTHKLSDLTVQDVPDLATGLRDYLRGGTEPWSDVVIDTPPSLAGVTITALVAADIVIAPVSMEREALEQLNRLEEVLRTKVGRRMRPGARIDWVVPTRFRTGGVMAREILEELQQTYGDRLTTPIREDVKVREAYRSPRRPGRPVTIHAPTTRASQDYIEAIGTIIRAGANS
ncbi:ParA family protein [Calidifontibacter indicus]|uniref:Septum site-determining protein MinD n=1 Tax=Calidifontibacter indicus TaxID=419650 RepID=A0A3D9UII5_9MICO|nr:ParA family protein [Calidifontibacter indicus]REF24631.1 septum site-determining protein MinD [Calidifontibacter indicus]